MTDDELEIDPETGLPLVPEEDEDLDDEDLDEDEDEESEDEAEDDTI